MLVTFAIEAYNRPGVTLNMWLVHIIRRNWCNIVVASKAKYYDGYPSVHENQNENGTRMESAFLVLATTSVRDNRHSNYVCIKN